MNMKPRAMRDALLERVHEAMARDPRIFFTCADFGSPVLDKIREQHPDRFINVGVAEQNLINVSAGLSLEGFTVFAYAIAPFITMRCHEQVRVNLALLSQVRRINVNLIGVGAGYSYVVSGPTHQCYEDLTVMRALPAVRVFSPADHVAAAGLFDVCASTPGPKYLRLDAQVLPPIYETAPSTEDGFHVHRKGDYVVLLATGYMLHTALKAAERLATSGLDVGVVDIFDIDHFNASRFKQALAGYSGIVTMEEGFRGRGGLDAMMSDFARRQSLPVRILAVGVEPSYRFELGTRAELHELVGIGVEAVEKNVTSFARTLSSTLVRT